MFVLVRIRNDDPDRDLVRTRIPHIVMQRRMAGAVPRVAVLLIDSVLQVVCLPPVAVEIILAGVEEHVKIYSRSCEVNVPTNGNQAMDETVS